MFTQVAIDLLVGDATFMALGGILGFIFVLCDIPNWLELYIGRLFPAFLLLILSHFTAIVLFIVADKLAFT